MKFSITIDTGYRDIPKEEKMRLRKEKLKAELKYDQITNKVGDGYRIGGERK